MELYQKEEPEAIAAVRVAKAGRQPPGKMYSLMKSELCRYASYLSSGIDITCKTLPSQHYSKYTHSTQKVVE
jgi:hypothetical protein